MPVVVRSNRIRRWQRRAAYRPAAQDDALMPWSLPRRHGLDGLRDAAHDGGWVVVQLGPSVENNVHSMRIHLVVRTLMSSNSQISSSPGEARYSSTSTSRGMRSCGSLSVRSVLRYAQSQSITYLLTPKHRFSVASWHVISMAGAGSKIPRSEGR